MYLVTAIIEYIFFNFDFFFFFSSDFDLGLCNRLIVNADSGFEDQLEKRTDDDESDNEDQQQQQVENGDQQPIQKSFKVSQTLQDMVFIGW